VIIVLYGVSGSGKSHVGNLLARQLGWTFLDADDYHPPENIHKMKRGEPLSDVDRLPWLRTLADKISNLQDNHVHAVLACSALKQAYRDVLGVDNDTVVAVLLSGDPRLIERRLQQRQHAFMPVQLLRSQLAALEPPATGLVFDIADTPEKICSSISRALNLVSQ